MIEKVVEVFHRKTSTILVYLLARFLAIAGFQAIHWNGLRNLWGIFDQTDKAVSFGLDFLELGL